MALIVIEGHIKFLKIQNESIFEIFCSMVEIDMTVSKRKLGKWVHRNVDRILRTFVFIMHQKMHYLNKGFVAGLPFHNLADNCFRTRESVIFLF